MNKPKIHFSLKPTKFIVLSFTISSSILFLFFFSILVFHTTPSIPQYANPNPKLNISSLIFPFKPLIDQNLTIFSINFTKTEEVNKPHDFTEASLDSVGNKLLRNVTELSNKPIEKKKKKKSSSSSSSSSECDVTHGRWVYDESYPLYTSNSCPFIDEGFSCEANGRSDNDYMKWRWQPYDCDLPRFNATKLLEMIRGKRLLFVGDSMNRNQWESMLCVLFGAVKDPKRVYEVHGRKITKEKGNYSFKFQDYGCTVEYYVTHFLVHESKGRVKQKRVPTLRIDTMDRGASRWKGADFIVFNTAHWWTHYKTKSGVNYYQEGNIVLPYLDASTAFRRALKTWASWVDKNIKPGRTKVFFRSSAPAHFRGGQWNSGGHCKNGIHPLNDTLEASYPEKNLIVDAVIKEMKTPVNLLNITLLSGLRIDGHPSVYGKKPGKGTPSNIQDCSHWCLPGVPDTWNELLYYYIQLESKKFSKV